MAPGPWPARLQRPFGDFEPLALGLAVYSVTMGQNRDYDALERELEELRQTAAQERATLEEELQRMRERRLALEEEAAAEQSAQKKEEEADEERGLLPKFVRDKAELLMLMLALALPAVGQFVLFEKVVVPWACGSACKEQGLSFVSAVRRGAGGRGENVVAGCYCRGSSPSARCGEKPRPGVHICKDPIADGGWIFLPRLLGSILVGMALSMILAVILVKPRRKR